MTVNPSNDELSVYVIHLAAQRLLRNDLTYWIKTVRGFEALDLEKLKLNLKIKAQEREDKLISLIAKDLPVFEF